MHELALAQSIVEAVEEKAQACHASRVRSVRLRIGEASGVVINSLTFCFEMLVEPVPLLAETRLLIDEVPHRARCRQCNCDFAVSNFIAQCPDCQGWETEVISGTELRIVEMEIEANEDSESSSDEYTGREAKETWQES